jgi:hypothetical protein
VEARLCPACAVSVSTSSYFPLATGVHLKEKARRLGLCDPEAIMSAACSALSMLAYQEQLTAAKKRQGDKAQLKKVVEQSKLKMQELHAAAQKV